jgi:hypothetical protein
MAMDELAVARVARGQPATSQRIAVAGIKPTRYLDLIVQAPSRVVEVLLCARTTHDRGVKGGGQLHRELSAQRHPADVSNLREVDVEPRTQHAQPGPAASCASVSSPRFAPLRTARACRLAACWA